MLKKIFGRVREWWDGKYYRGNISNQVIDDEYQDGWIPLVSTARSETSLDSMTVENMRLVSRYLFLFNPYYKGLVRTYMKYVAGKKFCISSGEKKEDEIWQYFSKSKRFRRLFRTWVRKFFIDGETFLYLPEMKFIDPNIIKDPTGKNIDGIELNQFGEVESFHITDGKISTIIPASEVIHTKDSDTNEMRGIPYLLPLFFSVDQLKKWLQDRILLNRIRSSIALVRKTKAGPATTKTFSDAKVTSTQSPVTTGYGASLRKKIFEPGTVIDASNIDYSFLAPNVDARDVSEDGRNIGLTMSAMTGLPEFITRGDASNGNYASTMIAEGPAEKEVEDWQDFFEEEVKQVWFWVMQEAGLRDPGDPIICFPPIISRNRKEETDRNQVLFSNGVISVEEWRRREQVDSQMMDQEINGSM